MTWQESEFDLSRSGSQPGGRNAARSVLRVSEDPNPLVAGCVQPFEQLNGGTIREREKNGNAKEDTGRSLHSLTR